MPAIWWYELRNGLIKGEHRGRLDVSRSALFLERLSRIPITIRFDANESTLLRLARDRQLSVYDAAYLELAQRLEMPLATLDRRLANAALAAGVALL